MLRLIGIGCVFMFCAVMGNFYACAYQNEYTSLRRVCDMLFDIKSFVSCESSTLKEIFTQLKKNGQYSSFEFLNIDSVTTDTRAVVISSIESSPVFKSDEYNERLIRLFGLLGRTDKQSQLELLNGSIDYFEGQAALMRGQLAMKKRLCNSLGIAAGALMSVILL